MLLPTLLLSLLVRHAAAVDDDREEDEQQGDGQRDDDPQEKVEAGGGARITATLGRVASGRARHRTGVGVGVLVHQLGALLVGEAQRVVVPVVHGALLLDGALQAGAVDDAMDQPGDVVAGDVVGGGNVIQSLRLLEVPGGVGLGQAGVLSVLLLDLLDAAFVVRAAALEAAKQSVVKVTTITVGLIGQNQADQKTDAAAAEKDSW